MITSYSLVLGVAFQCQSDLRIDSCIQAKHRFPVATFPGGSELQMIHGLPDGAPGWKRLH